MRELMPIDDLFDERLATTSILEWTVEDVHYLLQSLGYPQYQHQLKGPLGSAGLFARLKLQTEHGISGDILVHLDHEALKDVGIHSVVR